MTINAAIFGLQGPELRPGEAAFFRDCNPFGFILFARNIETPAQVRKLCADLRTAVHRHAPIFIDQEGGRVQRLRPPHWRAYPPAALFGQIYKRNRRQALRGAYLHYRLIADDLARLGLNANCAPVLDLPVENADPIISDRAFSRHADEMIALAHAAMAGLMAGGVLPVIKHIPGHGRAEVDSHKALPVIKTSLSQLATSDFLPFKALREAPLAMTAHVVMRALDPDLPITLSKPALHYIRRELGYDGLIMSDDLDMKALKGDLTKLTEQTLSAGCDLALQCNGKMANMVKVAQGLTPLSGAALRRAEIATLSGEHANSFDREDAIREYEAVISSADTHTTGMRA